MISALGVSKYNYYISSYAHTSYQAYENQFYNAQSRYEL